MQVTTHQFKEAFLAGSSSGWVVELEADRMRSGALSPVRQKFDNHHLCLFVFETEDAAKDEEKNFASKLQTRISRVAYRDVVEFRSRVFGGSGTLVFLRNAKGEFALL